jgi:hypothetical protein
MVPVGVSAGDCGRGTACEPMRRGWHELAFEPDLADADAATDAA